MAAEYLPLLGDEKKPPQTAAIGLGSLSPITAEVQQREEQRAARDALYDAAKSDQDRRERILREAQTGGRRQAAEGLLQSTRGMEVGTGASAAMGRQAAADVLMQEQQMAAARAAETPAFSLAELDKTLLGEEHASGTLMTDRQGKMTSYWEQINAFDPEDQTGERDATIDALMQNELGQESPDWWVINWLNGMRSEPSVAHALPYGGDDAPIGVWYESEDGAWVMNQVGADGLVHTQTYEGEGKPPGAVEDLGEWVHVVGVTWKKEYVDEDGTVKTEYGTKDAETGEIS